LGTSRAAIRLNRIQLILIEFMWGIDSKSSNCSIFLSVLLSSVSRKFYKILAQYAFAASPVFCRKLFHYQRISSDFIPSAHILSRDKVFESGHIVYYSFVTVVEADLVQILVGFWWQRNSNVWAILFRLPTFLSG